MHLKILSSLQNVQYLRLLYRNQMDHSYICTSHLTFRNEYKEPLHVFYFFYLKSLMTLLIALEIKFEFHHSF
jgi:hypothetical protein